MHDPNESDSPPADLGSTTPFSDCAEDEERVGYGRPPKSSRFRKGRSGNPAGRPKGSLNRSTLRSLVAEQWLEEKIKIIERGREREVPRVVALLKKQGELALKGDRKVIKDCLDLLLRMAVDEAEPRGREESAVEDEVILNTHGFGTTHTDGSCRGGASTDDGGGDD